MTRISTRSNSSLNPESRIGMTRMADQDWGAMLGLAGIAISWLLTYALHSSLLLGAAWILGRHSYRLSDRLWKIALVGAVLTTSIQALGGIASLAGKLDLSSLAGCRRERHVFV